MIERHWKGIARIDQSDNYIKHLITETFPKASLMKGFVEFIHVIRDSTHVVRESTHDLKTKITATPPKPILIKLKTLKRMTLPGIS